MNPHVSSLTLSRRLKELGVKQESQFAWYHDREHFCGTELVAASNPRVEKNIGESDLTYPSEFLCSAFLSSELALPWEITKDGLAWDLCYYTAAGSTDKDGNKVTDLFGVQYQSGDKSFWQEEKTEADARAAMLIFLIENSLLQP